MSIRMKLLSAVGLCALAFVVFALIAWDTLIVTAVNGEYYQRIALGKDLVADVLPPPEYLVEAYLTIYQMLEEHDSNKLNALAAKSKSLRDDYEKQHAYWVKNLPEGALKDELASRSHQPAIKFLDVAEKEIIPRFFAGTGKAHAGFSAIP